MLADRAEETSTTTGTGTLNLDGAVAGNRGLVAAIGAGKQCYYVISHRTVLAEWEVGIGTVTDAATDTLSRDQVLSSSNAGALVDFSAGTKSVYVDVPSAVAVPRSVNLLLNPSFEHVLPGTHTTALKQNNVASQTKNTQFPGWQSVAPSGSPDMTIDAETSTISNPGGQAMKVTVANVGGGVPEIRQPWNATHAPLDRRAKGLRAQFATFALDVKLSAATANACRIGLYTDGTGGTTTYSGYHGANTNWERLLVSVLVPADATDVRIIIQCASATPLYYFDNGMVVSSSVALLALPYIPRLPILITQGPANNVTKICSWESVAGGAGNVPSNDANLTTQWSPNGTRPHWADQCYGMITAWNKAGQAGIIYPNGFGAYDLYSMSGGAANGVVCFGQDSLVRLQRADQDTYFGLYSLRYIGENL